MARRIFCLALIWGCLAVAAPPVGAEVSLTVGPALLDLSATPGAGGRHELTVSNTGNDPFDVTVAVESVDGLSPDRSAVDWLTVTPAEIELEPGAEQTIGVEIAVPEGLDSGGRYAKVSITTKAPETSGNAAAVTGQLGVGVLVTVDGDGELFRTADIARFAPVLEADGRVGFRALVQNDGNVHLQPHGEIEVNHAGGEPLGSLEFQGTTPHLPGSTKLLSTQGSLPLAPATQYEARATVSYGDDGQKRSIEASSAFALDPALTVAAASACENLDRGPTLQVDLRNDGTLGLEPAVTLAVQTAGGVPRGSAAVPAPSIVWPDDSAQIAVDFPERLESGAYVLVAQATYGPGLTVEHETPFEIGGTSGNAIPLCGDA